MIKMSINNVEEDKFDLTNDKLYALPMVVSRNSDGKIFVVITTYDGVIFFQDGDSISYSNKCYLKANYKFVRFLSKTESVTFTGEK